MAFFFFFFSISVVVVVVQKYKFTIECSRVPHRISHYIITTSATNATSIKWWEKLYSIRAYPPPLLHNIKASKGPARGLVIYQSLKPRSICRSTILATHTYAPLRYGYVTLSILCFLVSASSLCHSHSRSLSEITQNA